MAAACQNFSSSNQVYKNKRILCNTAWSATLAAKKQFQGSGCYLVSVVAPLTPPSLQLKETESGGGKWRLLVKILGGCKTDLAPLLTLWGFKGSDCDGKRISTILDLFLHQTNFHLLA